MGYNNEMPCRSTNMNLEDIERERKMSGWNQYVGEEEELEHNAGNAQEIRTEEKERKREGKPDGSTGMPMEESDGQGHTEQLDAEMIWHIENQKAVERDLRRMQAMYPETARILLPYVEEACDELEYEGSMMYDERPDYETVLRIRDKVMEKAKDEFEPMEPPERDEMLTMQYRPGSPRRRRGNWPGDFAQMMLLEEMHRRRCRSCRRW